jgi:hypothetical protein
MSSRPATAVLALTLSMVGCATPLKQAPATTEAAPCLPPGASAQVMSWPVVAARPVRVPYETGDFKPGLWVRYQQGGAAVVMIWSDTGLLAVDPNPDTDVPAWIDTALLADDGKTLKTAPPAERCRWRQAGGRPA